MGWDGGWWMVIWGTLVVIALAALVIWLVRSVVGRGGSSSQIASVDPLDHARGVLADRYARGELSSDEYRERAGNLV